MTALTEALRAALAAKPTPGPFIAVGEMVESEDDEVPDLCSTSDRAEPWGFGPEQRVKDAAYIAAACNAAPELLAEQDALRADALLGRFARLHLTECHGGWALAQQFIPGAPSLESVTDALDADAIDAALKERT
jgi:hypothetical protein